MKLAFERKNCTHYSVEKIPRPLSCLTCVLIDDVMRILTLADRRTLAGARTVPALTRLAAVGGVQPRSGAVHSPQDGDWNADGRARTTNMHTTH